MLHCDHQSAGLDFWNDNGAELTSSMQEAKLLESLEKLDCQLQAVRERAPGAVSTTGHGHGAAARGAPEPGRASSRSPSRTEAERRRQSPSSGRPAASRASPPPVKSESRVRKTGPSPARQQSGRQREAGYTHGIQKVPAKSGEPTYPCLWWSKRHLIQPLNPGRRQQMRAQRGVRERLVEVETCR